MYAGFGFLVRDGHLAAFSSDMPITYRHVPPPVSAYAALRAAAGWTELTFAQMTAGLANALYSITASDGDAVIGCARVVGDGAIYFYIQDVIVLPPYQGRGIGAHIMDEIFSWLHAVAAPGAFVALMAAEGVAEFYQRYGFQARPAGKPGMFLYWPPPDATPGEEGRSLG